MFKIKQKDTSSKEEVETLGGTEENVIEDIDEFIDKSVEEIIDYFTRVNMRSVNSYQSAKLDKEQLKEEAKQYIKNTMKHSNGKSTTEEEQEIIAESFIKFISSYDVLDELIEDSNISDIKVIRYDRIYVVDRGKLKKSKVKFRSKKSYLNFVEHLSILNKIGISDRDAIRSFVDKDTSDKFRLRFNITSEIINSVDYPYVYVRKVPKEKYGLDKLVELGMMTPTIKQYLIDKVESGESLLVCGRGGSGKTILMNELIEYIPDNISYDCIQSNDELFSIKESCGTFHVVLENTGESKVSYDLSDLGKNGLLTGLDMFIIGEIKGREAEYLSYASYTDHITWASIHSISTRDAHLKVADYAKHCGDSVEEILRKTQTMRIVVHLRKFEIDGISEVTGFNDETGRLEFVDIDLSTGKRIVEG